MKELNSNEYLTHQTTIQIQRYAQCPLEPCSIFIRLPPFSAELRRRYAKNLEFMEDYISTDLPDKIECEGCGQKYTIKPLEVIQKIGIRDLGITKDELVEKLEEKLDLIALEVING